MSGLAETFTKILDAEEKLPAEERRLHKDIIESGKNAKKKLDKGKAFEPAPKKTKKFAGSYVGDHHLVEEILRNGNPCYAIYNSITKQVLYSKHWQTDDGNTTLFPIEDEEVTKKFLHLPTQAEEYGSDEALIQEIKNFISTWLDIPDQDLTFATYNILKSWVYQRFHSINYLRAIGDYGSGKSRYLDAIGLLHRQPFKTTATATPAALFRVLNKWDGPTLVMDEADMRDSDETADTIKIINQGYEAGNPVIRCDPNDATKIEFHNVYCPKVLATRREFEDKAVESRCFTTYMSTTNKKMPPNLNAEFFEGATKLRNKLLMFRFRNYYSINPKAGEEFDLGNIEPRLKQISTSFIALFSDKPSELEQFKSFILSYQGQLKAERAESWEGQIVTAIVTLYSNGEKEPTATQIVECADLRDSKNNLYKPRAITATMKRLGFGTAKAVRRGNITIKIYEIDSSMLFQKAVLYVDDEQLLERLRYRVTDVTHVTGRQGVSTLTELVRVPTHHPTNDSNNGNTVTETTKITNVTDVTEPVTNVTDVTEPDSFFSNDQEILAYIPEDGFIQKFSFIEKFGEPRFNRMIKQGLIFEPRNGEIRVLK